MRSPVRVEYALTEKGRGPESAIVAIGQWAERVAVPAAQTETTGP
jgi:DNA-binding HxlR family transcriptional regulator